METEVDEWFKQEKEKLENKYKKIIVEKISSGKNYTEEKALFEKKIKKLFSKYEKKNFNAIKTEKWKKLLIKPINKINEGMDEFVDAFKEEK